MGVLSHVRVIYHIVQPFYIYLATCLTNYMQLLIYCNVFCSCSISCNDWKWVGFELVVLKILSYKSEVLEINEALRKEPESCNIAPFIVHKRLIGSSEFISFICRDSKHLLGYVICCGIDTDNGTMLEISKLYIFNKFRGEGYGSEVVSQIISLAMEMNIASIFAEPLDDAAKAFWSKTRLFYSYEINRFELNLSF